MFATCPKRLSGRDHQRRTKSLATGKHAPANGRVDAFGGDGFFRDQPVEFGVDQGAAGSQESTSIDKRRNRMFSRHRFEVNTKKSINNQRRHRTASGRERYRESPYSNEGTLAWKVAS